MEKVDYIYHIGHLDCDFVDTKEYKKSYAKFNHFVTRKNGMLIIDYKKYGKYLFENFYRFNEEQKVAVFELCFYLSLIQDDMRIFPIAMPLVSNHSLKTEVVSLPEVLATPEAMVLWNKAYEAGYIDEYYQPKCSRPEAALLAFEMASPFWLTKRPHLPRIRTTYTYLGVLPISSFLYLCRRNLYYYGKEQERFSCDRKEWRKGA